MSSGELSSLILGESKKAPKVLREGFLTKQGGRIRSWKKRWFVLLDAQVVLYYKDKPADSKTVAQGGFSIVKCSVELKESALLVSAPVSMAVKKGATAPKQSANRTFTMKGDDVVEWMSAIKKAKEPKPAAASPPMRSSTPIAAKKVAAQGSNKHASSGAVLMASKKVPEKTALHAAKKPIPPAAKDPERGSKIGDELLDASSESDEAPDEALRKVQAKGVKLPAKGVVKGVAKAPAKVVAKAPGVGGAVRKPSLDDDLEMPDEDKVLDDFEDEGREDDYNGGRGANHNGHFHFADGDLEIPETQEVAFNVDEDEEEELRRREEEEEAERLRQEELERKRRGVKSAPPKKALPLPTPPKKPVPVFAAIEEKNDDDDDDDDAGMEFFRKK